MVVLVHICMYVRIVDIIDLPLIFQLRIIIDKFMDMRAEQKQILDNNPKLTIGDVTTINLTQVYVSLRKFNVHTVK